MAAAAVDSDQTLEQSVSDPSPRGCRGCSTKFTFTVRKKRCPRCRLTFCSKCILKSPDDLVQSCNGAIKKKLCRDCNARVVVPLLDELELNCMPTRQLHRYLELHQVDHDHLQTSRDLARQVMATRQEVGIPDRETIMSPASESATSTPVTRRVTPSRSRSDRRNRRRDTPQRPSSLVIRTSNGSAVFNRGDNSLSNPSVLFAEHLLGSLLMAAGINPGEPVGGPRLSDEEYQAQQNEMRESHKKDLERQRIASKLHTVTSADQFSEMSVADLKVILEVNDVDHASSIEKSEIVAQVVDLWESTKAMEKSADVDKTCNICCDAPSDCVFLECGHMVTCTKCGEQLSDCPVCRKPIVRVVRVFSS